MKCLLLSIGKTQEAWIRSGMEMYLKRLPRYLPFEYKELPDVKNARRLGNDLLKDAEGKAFLSKIDPTDHVILLDEGGTLRTSRELAGFFEKHLLAGRRRLVLIIGGAYGFSPELYQRANGKLSLSPMTFSHQMVRVIALEQLYRAQSILKGEPYHHD